MPSNLKTVETVTVDSPEAFASLLYDGPSRRATPDGTGFAWPSPRACMPVRSGPRWSHLRDRQRWR